MEIQKIDKDYFFRCDLYKPFGDNTINGLKILQAEKIITNNIDDIKSKYNNTVVVHTSVHGVTGTIMAAVCNKYNIKCIIAMGGTNVNSIAKHKNLHIAHNYQADFVTLAKHGMFSALKFRINKMCNEKSFFNGCFTSNYSDIMDSLIDYNTPELPNAVDNIIIPIGSGISFSCIYKYIIQSNIQYKNIIGCCVGPNRIKDIIKYLGDTNYDYSNIKLYEVNKELNSAYSRRIFNSNEHIEFDSIYESKMWKWSINNDISKEINMYFVVGNNNF